MSPCLHVRVLVRLMVVSYFPGVALKKCIRADIDREYARTDGKRWPSRSCFVPLSLYLSCLHVRNAYSELSTERASLYLPIRLL